MLTFSGLQDEVKRRALRSQAGTEFDIAVKNAINSSLFRVSREAPWRVMRRKAYFDTITSYTSGSGSVSVTLSSSSWSVTGANLFTDKIQIGRKVKFGTDSGFYTIRTIHSNSSSNLDRLYKGVTSTGTTYEILPQEEYTIPMQAGHRMFLWHEAYGYPFKMTYIPDQTFFESSAYLTEKSTPEYYRMWGEDMISTQVTTATFISIQSSSASDTLTNITIFGNIAGYPASETMTTSATNATGVITSTNLFDSVERIAVSSATNGRITVKSITGDYTVAVIPQGNNTAVIRNKVQLYPLPTTVFPVNVYYYKDPLPLTNGGDIHELGGDFDEAVILFATAKLKYQDNQLEGDRFAQMYMDEVKSLRRTNMDKIDWFPTLKRPYSREDEVSPTLKYRQIGPNFGPSSRY